MIYRAKRILSIAVVAVVVLVGGPVLAQSLPPDNDSTQLEQTTERIDESTEETVKSREESVEANRQKRNERIDERKSLLQTRLSNAEEARIRARCSTAQASLSSISGRLAGIEMSRSQMYEAIINRLTNAKEGLSISGIDTQQLDDIINELKSKLDNFNSVLGDYKQAIADLVGMDCATDPSGFKATLLTARQSRQSASQSAQEIREYLTGTVKQTLIDIKNNL